VSVPVKAPSSWMVINFLRTGEALLGFIPVIVAGDVDVAIARELSETPFMVIVRVDETPALSLGVKHLI
jgi:hypothetical protein